MSEKRKFVLLVIILAFSIGLLFFTRSNIGQGFIETL